MMCIARTGRAHGSGRVLLGILIAIAAVTLIGPTDAGAINVYRDPPGYKGIKKPPRTKPAKGVSATLTTTGTFPDALVDEAGTAHIVWNEGRGDDADATMYCRLKRGATSCDATATLTWNKGYGVGDGPQFNTDNEGPRIVRVGDQLVVLSRRYPTIGNKPDGASSSTVVGWVSNDGGSTWSNATVLGKRSLGQLAVVGPDDDPTIVNLAHDPFCGGMCLTTYRSGLYTPAEGVLNTDPNSNYYGSIARDGNSLIAAFSDLNPRVWLRRWNGTGPLTNPASWSTAAPLPGDEPDLAGGPAGTFLMARPGYSGPYEVRSLATGGGNVVQPGPATTITPADESVSAGRLAEDPSGRLTAAWQQQGTGVRLSTSTSGAGGFSSAQTLLDGDQNGQIALDAAADGGGFAVVNHTGGINSPGEIRAIGFGSQGPTGQPGLGAIPGGGNVSCQSVGFGSFSISTAAGCFLKGTGNNKGVVVTSGSVTLNGLIIQPDPGSRLVIDPRALTIDTIGQASVIVRNGSTDVVLFHGRINRNLSGLRPGSLLFEFPAGEFAANVLGFDVAADIPVYLTADGVRIPIDVDLPAEFGGFTGHAELTADANGLNLSSLDIHIGPVPLGVLTVDSIDISWKGDQSWAGTGKLTVPAGGSIDAHVEFDQGEFKGAGFNYPLTPPATIGPFVYLLSVGGDLSLRPVVIAARAAFGAGVAVQGESPVKLDGQFTMRFPAAAPASFRFDGQVELFLFRIGQGFLEFQSDGYAQFGGQSQLELGPLSGGVNVEGFIDATTGQYGADINGNAQFCMNFDVGVDSIPVCGGVGAEAAVSSVGFAACARLNPPDPIGGVSAGLAMRWDDVSPGVLVSPVVLTAQIIESIAIPCDTAEYRIPPPRQLSARAERVGGEAIAIDGGLPTATILVKGSGGTPDVTVRGPGGQTVSPASPSKDGYVAEAPGSNAAWVVLNKPQGGDWSIEPNAGSPPISELLVSNGYEPAQVKRARVRRGRISYRISDLGSGQKVIFRESGKFGVNVIGATTRSRGTIRFKPAKGPGGKRKVVALISRDGLITDRKQIGSYKAPSPPRPGPVKRLRARRSGSKLTVSFRPSPSATRTTVHVTGKHGVALAKLVGGHGKKATFGGVRWVSRLKVAVRSFSRDGRAGPTRKVVVGGKRKK